MRHAAVVMAGALAWAAALAAAPGAAAAPPAASCHLAWEEPGEVAAGLAEPWPGEEPQGEESDSGLLSTDEESEGPGTAPD